MDGFSRLIVGGLGILFTWGSWGIFQQTHDRTMLWGVGIGIVMILVGLFNSKSQPPKPIPHDEAAKLAAKEQAKALQAFFKFLFHQSNANAMRQVAGDQMPVVQHNVGGMRVWYFLILIILALLFGACILGPLLSGR